MSQRNSYEDTISTRSSTADLIRPRSLQANHSDINACNQQVGLTEFSDDDPENPYNCSRWKKYTLIGAILLIDLSVSWGASGYSPAAANFAKDMHVSSEVAILGLSLYVIGLALGPMCLAPLSEYFGRSPIYIIAYGIYLLWVMGTALVANLGGFLVLRFLSGLFSSVTVANFGGTIADLYTHTETGYAMSLFLWAATCGSPSGFFIFSFVAETHSWRDVFWAIMGVSAGLWVIMVGAIAVVGETRHDVLLLKRFKRQQGVTSTFGVEIPDKLKRRGTKELFQVALTRPFRFLFTEVIIQFGAVYNGYLYGLSFLFNSAFVLVFGSGGHNFNTTGVGSAFLGVMVGITLGPITNIYQERYFQQRIRENNGHIVPEARVQLAKVAAVVFPCSLFWFAWTASPSIHYIVPIIASAFWGWAFYTLILMTYTYTEDSYKTFSASALAGLGLVRNLMGGGFPLFGTQLFKRLGTQWAGSLLAFLAIALVPIPFILEKYGHSMRYRSPYTRQHMEDLVE